MRVRVLLCAFVSVVFVSSLTLLAKAEQDTQKPYTITDGKVDKKTFNGWRRYTESCLRCHGPDGAGSSYAPSLVNSVKHMTQDEFNEIVVNGRTNVNAASENVMPPFRRSRGCRRLSRRHLGLSEGARRWRAGPRPASANR